MTLLTPNERDELKQLVKEAFAEVLAERAPPPPPKARPGFLTLAQAGELLGGTSPDTIRNWIWRGLIKAYKPGGKPLLRETELLAFVEANESRAKRVARKKARQAEARGTKTDGDA